MMAEKAAKKLATKNCLVANTNTDVSTLTIISLPYLFVYSIFGKSTKYRKKKIMVNYIL